MEKLKSIYVKFLTVCIGIIFLVVFVVTCLRVFVECSLVGNILYFFTNIILGIIYGGIIYLSYNFIRHIRNKLKTNQILLIILIISFAVRCIIVLMLQTKPVSDFYVVYESASSIAKGNMLNYDKTNYIVRFPHLIGMMLYFALIQVLTPMHQIVVLLLNSLYAAISIFIFYKIAYELSDNEDSALKWTFVYSVFPSNLLYPAVFCSENMAIPIYLLCLYLFIIFTKKQKLQILCLCGVVLSFATFMRFVGQIILIAYIIYILVFLSEKIIKKIVYSFVILTCFIITLVVISYSLILFKITDFHIWQGSEPAITSVLKGSNMAEMGRWNLEDTLVVDKNDFDYKRVEDESKKIIIERITKTPFYKVIFFYISKIGLQWSSGDFGASFWIQTSRGEKVPDIRKSTAIVSQVVYIIILFNIVVNIRSIVNFGFKFAYKNEHNANNKNKEIIFLLLTIFFGFALFYDLIEYQDRYAYIINWIWILFWGYFQKYYNEANDVSNL